MVTHARAYLEDNQAEHEEPAVRCGIVVTRDEAGKERFHPEVIDAAGYASRQELVREIASIFNISRWQVLVN